MIDVTSFRNGMALLAGAVNVITTDGPKGFGGFTATAVCSVTDNPPTLLVCMNRSSYAHPIFTGNGALCVNVLGADQQATSAIFSDRNVTMDERFARIGWHRQATGSPLIDGALASFDCRITHTREAGSHSIFLCEVAGIRLSDPRGGLVYFNRHYHAVGDAASMQS